MYLVFGGECYYARGGINDLRGKADLWEEAQAIVLFGMRPELLWNTWDWYQVVNAATGELVAASEVQAHSNN